jgi:NitT/TauT family transport system permease protein
MNNALSLQQASTMPQKKSGKKCYALLRLYIGRLLIGAAFCAVWWALVEFGVVPAFFVSSPDAVALYLWGNLGGELVTHGIDTLMAMLVAFVLSGVLGILAGLLLVEVPLLRRLIDPYLTGLNSMPRIALAPIFILWFGIGMGSKVALAFSLGFFIVLNSTIAGIRNIDPILVRLSDTLGCSSIQRFWKITLPWAVPSVFAGLKLALIYSFLGVVTSEMIASRSGLGYLVMYYSGIFRMDAILGILFVMAVAAVAITMIADAVETRLLGSWTEPTVRIDA